MVKCSAKNILLIVHEYLLCVGQGIVSVYSFEYLACAEAPTLSFTFAMWEGMLTVECIASTSILFTYYAVRLGQK